MNKHQYWLGKKKSEETKRKISEALKGRKIPREQVEKSRLARIGHKVSLETRRKIGMKNSIALKGRKMPEEVKEKIRQTCLRLKIGWKGDDAGYGAIHSWLYRNFGKPIECEKCGEKKRRITWANKDHKYKRDRSEWMQLCYSCHKKHDLRLKSEEIKGY